jgi:hypothetical protein
MLLTIRCHVAISVLSRCLLHGWCPLYPYHLRSHSNVDDITDFNNKRLLLQCNLYCLDVIYTGIVIWLRWHQRIVYNLHSVIARCGRDGGIKKHPCLVIHRELFCIITSDHSNVDDITDFNNKRLVSQYNLYCLDVIYTGIGDGCIKKHPCLVIHRKLLFCIITNDDLIKRVLKCFDYKTILNRCWRY